MIRNIVFISIVFCLFGGWFVYLEINTRDFVEDLPKPPSTHINDTSVRSSSAIPDIPDEERHPIPTQISEQSNSESIVKDDTSTQQDATEQDPDNFFDWRNDDQYPDSQVIRDPWRLKETDTALITNHEEMTPDELSEALHALRIKQFGDIPEVHTFTEIERKFLKRIPTTVDEDIAYFEAAFHLYPSQEIEHSLKLAEWKKSKGPNFNINGKDIEALRKLGIKIERRGNQIIVNPPPN